MFGPDTGQTGQRCQQLMNRSLDTQEIKIRGLIESLTSRKDGWVVVNLRTKDGVLKVVLLRAGIKGASLEENANAIIRVRGRLSVDRDPATQRVIRSEEHTSELQSRQYLVCRL